MTVMQALRLCRLRARLFALAVPALVALGASMAVTAQPKHATPGSVSGTVMRSTSGSPVTNALVTLSNADDWLVQTGLTDERGRFAFPNVPAGRYYLSARMQDYLESAFGAAHPGWSGTPIRVTSGTAVTKLAITLWQGGAVTGTITGPEGAVLRDVIVAAFRLGGDDRAHLAPASPSARSLTDDRGVFRLFNLPPGWYGVLALPTNRVVTPAARDAPSQSRSYVPAYYPGATELAEASPVRVDADTERSGLDFTLLSVQAATITGSIQPPGGRPFANVKAQGSLCSRSDTIGCRAVHVAADGKLQIGGVAPGRHRITVRATAAYGDHADAVPTPALYGEIEVAVSPDGSDVTDVAVLLRPAARLSGRIEFEGASSEAPVGGVSVDVRLIPAPRPGQAGDPRVTAATNGSFSFDDIPPGPYVVSARAVRQAAVPGCRWRLKSARIGGLNAADNPYHLEPGRVELRGLVVFARSCSAIFGRLGLPEHALPGQYLISIVPAEPTLWTSGLHRIVHVRPDHRGEYRASGLAPGTYLIAVTSDDATQHPTARWFLQQVQASASTKVTLRDDETLRVDLVVPSAR